MPAEREAIWVILASQGEYSDRSEWPVGVCHNQQDAEFLTVRIGSLWRELCTIYRRREDELDEAGDWNGDTLWETDEGRELFAITGVKGSFSSVYADERSYYCQEVPIFHAKAMETGTAKTEGLGAKHDSAGRKALPDHLKESTHE